MACNYKTTYNLIPDQIAELKNSLFYEDAEGVFEDLISPSDIPDSVVHEHYKGINFVNDDFFCTAGMDDEEVIIYMITQCNRGKQMYYYEIDFEHDYHMVIRADFEDMTIADAIKLLPPNIKAFGNILNIKPISIRDMVKLYDCSTYANWPIHHKPN